MRLHGKTARSGKWWLVEIPILDVETQGRTKKEALLMAAALVESLVGTTEFSVTVHPGKGSDFELSASDTRLLVALLLKRQRQKSGLTLAQAAKRLGARSRNAYARYEQGVSVPTVEKLNDLLLAVGAERDFVIRESCVA